jgi:peptidyl-prolyl cis-trans isomerase C
MIRSKGLQLSMKALSFLLFACLAGMAQTAPPPAAAAPWANLPDDTVIVVFEDDGYSMTLGEFKKLYAILPSDAQQNALKETEDFLRGWGVMRKLSRMAKTQKLEEGSPAHEQLEYYTMRILAEAELEDVNHHVTVPAEEARQYYDAHKDKYKEVRLKAIKLDYSDGAASSSTSSAKRTEEETKVLAAKLVADLRGGADFVKLVAQYSDDATSKAKNGDFATIQGSDNIPEQIRSVVMALKPGDVSEPVAQPRTLYIFRAESVAYKPFEQVSDEIFAQVRREHYAQWMFQMNHDIKVDFKSPAFLGKGPGDGKPPSAH